MWGVLTIRSYHLAQSRKDNGNSRFTLLVHPVLRSQFLAWCSPTLYPSLVGEALRPYQTFISLLSLWLNGWVIQMKSLSPTPIAFLVLATWGPLFSLHRVYIGSQWREGGHIVPTGAFENVLRNFLVLTKENVLASSGNRDAVKRPAKHRTDPSSTLW